MRMKGWTRRDPALEVFYMGRRNLFGVRRWAVIVLAVGALFASGVATADDRGRGAIWVDDMVSAIDERSGTLTVGDRELTVSDRSRLMDVGDRPIRLYELEVGQMVSYTAATGKAGQPNVVRALRVLEGDFE